MHLLHHFSIILCSATTFNMGNITVFIMSIKGTFDHPTDFGVTLGALEFFVAALIKISNTNMIDVTSVATVIIFLLLPEHGND